MIKQITTSIRILYLLIVLSGLNAQDTNGKKLEKVTKLFRDDQTLSVIMSLFNKEC